MNVPQDEQHDQQQDYHYHQKHSDSDSDGDSGNGNKLPLNDLAIEDGDYLRAEDSGSCDIMATVPWGRLRLKVSFLLSYFGFFMF